MEEKKDQKSALACDIREMRDEVASYFVRDTYSRKKSFTLLSSWHERQGSTALFRDMKKKKKSREEADSLLTFYLLVRLRRQRLHQRVVNNLLRRPSLTLTLTLTHGIVIG